MIYPSHHVNGDIVRNIVKFLFVTESLRAIHQAFAAAQEILSLKLELETKPKLDR